MNLNQLEYFISVAENLNFTVAAKKCYISQTAMTQQIKALENTVGVPLFIRDKHHVELTEAGNIFLKEARVIIDRSQKALKLVRTSSTGLEGKLVIGFIRGYAHGSFIDFIRTFHHEFPNIQIQFISDNSSILFEKLEKGECDVIFTIKPFSQDSTLEHYYIRNYPVYAALETGHPLCTKDSLTYSDLQNEDFIIMQPYRRAKDEAEESMLIYNRGGFIPNIVAMEGNPEILLSMISLGIGVSILPEYIIELYNDSNITFLPLLQNDGSSQTVAFEMSWKRDVTNPVIERFIDRIKKR